MKRIIIGIIVFIFYCSTPIIKETISLQDLELEHYKSKKSSQTILIQLDPLSLPYNFLHPHWIPYWLNHNYEILQIKQKESKILKSKDVTHVINSILQNHLVKNKTIILVGISLGGIALLDWLNEEETIPKNINKILIIGSGWDYSYQGNFFKENPQYLKNQIKNISDSKFNPYKEYLKLQYKYEVLDFYFPEISLNKKEVKHIINHNLPILIVIGKIDSFAPEDSIIPFIKNYTQCRILSTLNPCYYIEASRANFYDIDYNHFDLFLYENVESDLYEDIYKWLKLRN